MTTNPDPKVSQYRWHHELKQIFAQSIERYREGELVLERHFTVGQVAYLASIGQNPQEIYDFAEDHVKQGEPNWETVLLISAARRDYLLTVQRGVASPGVVSMKGLPPKDAQLGGIPWLPRIIKKAEAKLRGEMPAELMYLCGGDRSFLEQHGLEPADFLRHVWAADGDEQKVLAYVRGGGR